MAEICGFWKTSRLKTWCLGKIILGCRCGKFLPSALGTLLIAGFAALVTLAFVAIVLE